MATRQTTFTQETTNPVKVAVIYYSSTGTIYQLARAVSDGAKQAGAEVRLRKVKELVSEEVISKKPEWWAHRMATRDIPEATLADLEQADVFLFGTPTRFGNVASQLKQFIDTTSGPWLEGKLSNKVVTGFTSADNPHGGQESTLLALYNTFYPWGSVIVPPGYTNDLIFTAGGNPYGASATASERPIPEVKLEAARYLARRAVMVAGWVKTGRGNQNNQETTKTLTHVQ